MGRGFHGQAKMEDDLVNGRTHVWVKLDTNPNKRRSKADSSTLLFRTGVASKNLLRLERKRTTMTEGRHPHKGLTPERKLLLDLALVTFLPGHVYLKGTTI